MKLLGPWPVLQFMFGVGVLGFGIFMIVKGVQKKDSTPQIEDKRAEWEAYEQLRSIEKSAEQIAHNQRVMLEHMRQVTDQVRQQTEAMKGLIAAMWNFRQ